jgi:hypothetical protein
MITLQRKEKNSNVQTVVRQVSEKIYATAFWTQAIEGGKNGKWVRVMEPKTKLNSKWGPISVSEEAHIEALELWKKGIFAHIDHDKNKEFPLKINDAKYVPGEGLYILPDGDHPSIQMLRDGKAKPSIEIVANKEHYDGENRRAKKYTPIGLGIMIDGEANGINVGAFDPDLNEAIGGTTMGNEEKNEEEFEFSQEAVDTFIAKFENEAKEKPEYIRENVSDYRKNLKSLYGDAEVPLEVYDTFLTIYKGLGKKEDTISDKDEYKDVIKRMKEIEAEKRKKEELIKDRDQVVSALEKRLIENALEKAENDKIPMDIVKSQLHDGISINEVEAIIETEKKRMEYYNKYMPNDDDTSPGTKREKVRGLYNEDGSMNEEQYKKMKNELPFFQPKEQKLNKIFSKG